MLVRLSFKQISPSNQILGANIQQGACLIASFILACNIVVQIESIELSKGVKYH